jgi:hypothetical protein
VKKDETFAPHKIRTTIFLLWKVLQKANAIFFIMLLKADAPVPLLFRFITVDYVDES